MKQNKVLALAAKQHSKAWTGIQLGKPYASLNPNDPPLYLIDVAGQRGDGVVFKVTVNVDKARYDLLRGADSIVVAATLINSAIRELMTYAGCPCTESTECERHKKGAVN